MRNLSPRHAFAPRHFPALGTCIVLALFAPVAPAAAQEVDPEVEAPRLSEAPRLQPQAPLPQPGAPGEYVNPWDNRPTCSSMFLKSDWQLTSRQRACDWIHNRLLSTNAIAAAAFSAGVSKVRDARSERGDGFATRFSRRFAQSAFKSAGAYIGGAIAHEDPRIAPPYLVMRDTPRPRGFLKRTRHALAYNFVSYRCLNGCRTAKDIDRQPALSRMLGALASGYASEVWTWDRKTSHQRALRGAATAYGSSFLSALFTEFKPELSGFASRTFAALSGGR